MFSLSPSPNNPAPLAWILLLSRLKLSRALFTLSAFPNNPAVSSPISLSSRLKLFRVELFLIISANKLIPLGPMLFHQD